MSVFFSRNVAITSKIVDDFMDFSGDHNLLHTDSEWTINNTRFKRRIAHGAILNAFVSKFITEAFGNGTVYVEQLMQFKCPVFRNDLLTINFLDLAPIKKLTKFKTEIILCESSFIEEDHKPGMIIATGHAVIVAKNTPVAQLAEVTALEVDQ